MGMCPDDVFDSGIGFLTTDGDMPIVILGEEESGAADYRSLRIDVRT